MFASKDSLLTRPSGGYTIARSVRLRSSANGNLSRTPSSATDRKTWTWSGWVKRGLLTSGEQVLFSAGSSYTTQTYFTFYIGSDNKLVTSTGSAEIWRTTQVFRDPAAWYHMVLVVDTTQATADNRTRLYINGTEVTSFSRGTNLSLNTDYGINYNIIHYIGRDFFQPIYFDGYLTEINFIDGQALTPSSFGETDSITGVWKPKAFSGTYGTNGFYLNFSDNSNNTAATIGKDYSGNGNNWTPNNISVTAGVTYDSMTDVPTLTSATAANYAVLNPLSLVGNTFSEANLKITAAVNTKSIGTIALPATGKWYWESVWITNGGGSNPQFGLVSQVATATSANDNLWYRSDGDKYDQTNTDSAYGATWTTNDVIGVAVDMDAGTLTFYKNNTSQGIAFSTITTRLSGNIFPSVKGNAAGDVLVINFGQRPFTYTPPTGYVALNTYNLPASTITNGAAYMAATTYTGTGASLTVANTVGSTSFQPDWVWTKRRSTGRDHALYDSVRGAQNYLSSNLTDAELSGIQGVLAFNSNGFNLGADGDSNASGSTYVAWQWKAGGTSSSNTNGSITSTVSVGATQGFSVVTYTGTGANATVGHGLGVAPSMVIVKRRDTTSTWQVRHTSIAVASSIQLNSTAASASATTVWNSTAPTSTVFSIGTSTDVNASSGTYVAYCFSAVAGYSAFGSFTGNGSADGPFVYTSFRPRWIMWKNSSTGGTDWTIVDSSRNTYNVANSGLQPNGSYAEASNSNYQIDFLSNGFKLRTTNAEANQSGISIIYAAFAENPFRNALAR